MAESVAETPAVSGEAPRSALQAARHLLKALEREFAVFRDHAPLAIGIDRQLRLRRPDLERKVLRIALGLHTNSLRYLKSMEKAERRLDLDGKPAEEVSEEHRRHAAETLRERFRKEAEKRKAQRNAEIEAKRQAVQEERHQQKLNQLVEKFGRR